jgi:hypothetical protein
MGIVDMKITIRKRSSCISEAAVEDISKLGLYVTDSYIILYDRYGVGAQVRHLDGDKIEPFIKGVVRLGWEGAQKAFKVEEIWAEKGYGPTLYRIAIQHAGRNGLMPSTIKGQVSPAAENVWKEFYDGKGSDFVDTKKSADDNHGVEHLDSIYYSNGPQINTSKAEQNHSKIFNKAKDPYEEKLTTLLESADSVLQDLVRMNEDEEQRLLRAKHTDPENLLSLIYKKFNGKWGRPIPYHGAKTVKIYRGINPKASKSLRPGDWVSLTKSYAQEHGGEGSIVVSMEVPSEHVSWAGTDESEWFYTPAASSSDIPSEPVSESEKVNEEEPYQKAAKKSFGKMMRLTVTGNNKYKVKGMKTINPKVGKSAPPGV